MSIAIAIAIAIGTLVSARLLLRLLTHRDAQATPSSSRRHHAIVRPTIPSTPVDSRVGSFGPKCAWITVRSDDSEAVIRAFGARSFTRVPFGEGAARAYAGEFFVTPSIDGWVLIASVELLEWLTPDDEQPTRDLAEVSARLGTWVGLFGSHRVVETHGYVLHDAGTLVRAYVWSGEQGRVLRDEGVRQPVELEHSVGQDQSTLEASWESSTDERELNEDTLFAVAGELSLDPTTFEERGPMPEGWIITALGSIEQDST